MENKIILNDKDKDFSIYTIADLHLSLNEITQKPMDLFGSAWINHVQILEENWKRTVKDNDLVIIPGDISWSMTLIEADVDLSWIDSLPGKKVIFKGNHDLWWSSIKKMNTLYETIYFMQNDIFVYGDIAVCGTRGWICDGSDKFKEEDTKIYKREILRLEMSLNKAKDSKMDIKEIIGFLHYPPTNERREPSGFTDLFDKYGIERVFYGHLHGKDAKRNKDAFVIGNTVYKLVSLDALSCHLLKIK
ncbi:MAG: metallophosphoesterase [Eubacteriales bacterium]|nr:metallophosphoesterase [Eubacteriales bacterium]MDY3332599.1 metallophosphoesterase [Gallibacter sp.]